MTIESFGKNTEHFFLSNMYPVGGGIEASNGMRARSAENLYQAEKFTDPVAAEEVLKAEDGYAAKKAAGRLESIGAEIRDDWEEVRLDIMRKVTERKFSAGSKMANMLLATGDEELVHGNTHGDTFWGVSPPGSDNGENWQGRLLMERRAALKAES